MRLTERISLLVRANLSSLLGQSGGGPTDRQRSIHTAERELARAREALAKAMEHQKALAEQVAAAEEQTQTWAQKAEEALQAGDEIKAREALNQQQKQERLAKGLRARLERQQEETDRLEARLEMLDTELKQARRQVTAEATQQAPAGSPLGTAKPEGRLASPPATKAGPLNSDIEARKARLSKK